ncbi:UV-stimulated scaffold protein A [Orchesella cincta]|uniref:UV-stimulated scaffold protein A n=1 Tax=Orchesella cincta TaxID=48709 RepID=A0A1D2MFK6_ORCCI|nr:UV-stimulated scaffold protein A [Orchesella cincta]
MSKSEYFRELLLDDFHVFLELTVESNSEKLLPPPIPAAKKLKQRVLQSIHKWYSNFQGAHKRLALSYNFLKHNLKVDFDDALKRNAFELQQDLVERQRQSKLVGKKVDSIKSEMEEKVDELSRIITEMNNCFSLLIPKPNDLFQDEGNTELDEHESVNADTAVNLREHGIVDRRTVISIQLYDKPQQIRITEDNAAVVETLKDHYQELKNGYLPSIKKWIQVASKSDDETLFRKVMDLKSLVEEEMKRFEELKLVEPQNASDSEEESDSDFEDVPDKEGYEETVEAPPVVVLPVASTCSTSIATSKLQTPDNAQSEDVSWRPWNENEDDAKDPATLSATLAQLKSKQSKIAFATTAKTPPTSTDTKDSYHDAVPGSSRGSSESRKERLLKCAPKLPYDVDLYHWEDEKLTAPSIEIVETDGHKFWTPSQDRAGEVFEDPNGIASLRTRVIEFTGKFEPVKWSCRAPLPSGKLCPRRDRYKCPLHGKIVARDETGNPVKVEDIAELEAEKAKAEAEKPPDWQDPEFLKDIEAQTGMDLTIRPPKRGKKKQTFSQQYPGLTDVDKKKNTPRSRLEKKVLNKQSLKRVASTMDSLSHKRFRDKFGDQWNYAMNDD